MDFSCDVILEVFRVKQHLKDNHFDDVSDLYVPSIKHAVVCVCGGGGDRVKYC